MDGEWKQLNQNVYQRVYPCGTVGIVSRNSGEFTVDTIDSTGKFEAEPLGSESEHFGTLSEMQDALDKRFDPQPEILCRSETVTVFKLGGNEKVVYKSELCGRWFTLGKYIEPDDRTREAVEKCAKDWLKQQERST